MRKLSVMICLCILGFTGDTNAWGWEGHKLVCALAEEQFSNEAKKMVNHLLADGSKLKGGQKNFPVACLWPDDVKYSSRKGTYEHHFINVPDDANRIDLQRDCAALNCIAVGLQQALHYLSLPARGDRDKLRRAAALRFLGHYVADLHQPLHVGNASDWGAMCETTNASRPGPMIGPPADRLCAVEPVGEATISPSPRKWGPWTPPMRRTSSIIR